MKKGFICICLVLAGIFTYGYGQDVRVNINNQDYSSNDDCEFKINGICSSEDIGGVEIHGLRKFEQLSCTSGTPSYADNRYAVLTNYNDFTVTVLVDFYNQRISSVVLRKNETKEVFIDLGGTTSSYRPSEEISCPLRGMIVRKLAQ